MRAKGKLLLRQNGGAWHRIVQPSYMATMYTRASNGSQKSDEFPVPRPRHLAFIPAWNDWEKSERKEKKKNSKKICFQPPCVILYIFITTVIAYRSPRFVSFGWQARTLPAVIWQIRCHITLVSSSIFFPLFLTVPLEASRAFEFAFGARRRVEPTWRLAYIFVGYKNSRERASFFFFSFSLSGWVAKFDGQAV